MTQHSSETLAPDSLASPPPGSGKTLLDRVEDSLLPLINLVFLLLMFFIVAGQLTDTALPDLPSAQSRSGSDQQAEADLVVNQEGQWLVNNKVVSPDQLLARLPDPAAEQTLRIGAAANTTMSALDNLLRLLEEGGYGEVILLTEPGQ